MRTSSRIAWLAVLAISPLFSHGAEPLAVNPTPHLAKGGIAHANNAFEDKTGMKVSMPKKSGGCGATVLGLKTGKLDAGMMAARPTRKRWVIWGWLPQV